MGLVAFFLLLGLYWLVRRGDAFASPNLQNAFRQTSQAEDLEEPSDPELSNNRYKKLGSIILNTL